MNYLIKNLTIVSFMDKLIEYLAGKLYEYSHVDLDRTYQSTKYDCQTILSDKEISELGKLNPLQRQITLKERVSAKLNGSFENWETNAWIVHKWGMISGFDINKHDRIIGFKDNLSGKGSISSLSKIASFVFPKKYFVYDSRVAFAINGLILDYLFNYPEETEAFYPIPSAQGGRDKKMTAFIRERVSSATFISRDDSYRQYNGLILKLSEALNNKGIKQPPCWVEMLLFELGKTKGIIELMHGLNGAYEAPDLDCDDGIYPLDGKVKSPNLSNSEVLSGYLISRSGHGFYLFVGKYHVKKKVFCQVQPGKGGYPETVKLGVLENQGFEYKSSGDRYIRYFDLDQKAEAIKLMESLKDALL